MRWNVRPPKNMFAWHTWFAWYPVKADIGGITQQWVWLETIERWDGIEYLYRVTQAKDLLEELDQLEVYSSPEDQALVDLAKQVAKDIDRHMMEHTDASTHKSSRL